MFNIKSKSLLAKLLAEENINIEFKKTYTASFDVLNRNLVIPILKDDLSEDVINLFILHECAHALFSPTDEYLDAIKIKGYSKSLLNILEDIRIEKKIQIRYPGAKKDFINGYKELNDVRDFFKISDTDLNSLKLLDRINLFFKIGASSLITFSDKESVFIDDAYKLETFEDVLELADKIINFLKESIEDEDEDEDDDKNIEISGDKENDMENIGDSDIEEQLRSDTQDAFDDNIEDLIDDDCKDSMYINIDLPDSSKFIISYNTILSKLEQHVKDANSYNFNTEKMVYNRDYVLYNQFISKNRNTIDILTNEFNLRKNANGLRKAKDSKTGDLSVEKLFKYKISADIFRKVTMVSDDQSHGLVFFIDWSGSMQNYLKETINQLICLLVFARKLNIPFRVYAFSDNAGKYNSVFGLIKNYELPIKDNTFYFNTSKIALLELFSSNMNSNDFKLMANLLLGFNGYLLDKRLFLNYKSPYSYLDTPSWIQLGRTPLDESIVLAMDIVPKFKAEMKLDKAHTIFLTDGESYPQIRYSITTNYGPSNRDFNIESFKNSIVYFRENSSKITKRVIKESFKMKPSNYSSDISGTTTLFSILKELIQDNLILYRIIQPKELEYRCGYYFRDKNLIKLKSELNKNNYISTENYFSNKTFVLKSNTLGISDEDFIIDNNSTINKMSKVFSKSMKSKANNRIFLNEFISMIG